MNTRYTQNMLKVYSYPTQKVVDLQDVVINGLDHVLAPIPGVLLTLGELRVQFSSLAQLAELLLQTALALDRNFDHYADAVGPDPEEQRQRELERQDADYLGYLKKRTAAYAKVRIDHLIPSVSRT